MVGCRRADEGGAASPTISPGRQSPAPLVLSQSLVQGGNVELRPTQESKIWLLTAGGQALLSTLWSQPSLESYLALGILMQSFQIHYFSP